MGLEPTTLELEVQHASPLRQGVFTFMEKTFSTFIYSAGLPKLNVSSSTSFVPGDSIPRSSNDFINCLLLNVRSLRDKINDLSALLSMDYFDIVAMTETWLDDDFIDSELQLDGCNIFR